MSVVYLPEQLKIRDHWNGTDIGDVLSQVIRLCLIIWWCKLWNLMWEGEVGREAEETQ